MPHVILEYSNNVKETDFTALLKDIHLLLTEKLPTDLNHCKSRVIKHDGFVVGDNNPKNAFVHMTILVLKGRSEDLLNEVGAMIMEKLKSKFKTSLTTLNLDISIAINHLPGTYLKNQKT